MKLSKVTIRGLAFAMLFAAGTASAADVGRAPYVTPYAAPPYPAYSWAGPYVGFNLGYQWASATNSGADPHGMMGGIQGGYNWQLQQVILGLEADLALSGADDTFAGWKFSNPWFGTVRGRAGFAMNNVLLYATLGLAYGRGEVELAGITESTLHFGWAGGLGMEVGFTPNWSARAEYLFVDLSDQRYVLFGNTGFESSIFRLGANYRF